MPRAATTIRPPILTKALEPATAVDRLDEVELEQCRLEEGTFANQAGERVHFDGVHVVGGTLAETKIGRVSWVDVLCERCDLSMIDWPKAKLTRVEFRNCRATGAKVLEGQFEDVRFVDCHLEYATFPAGRFAKVAFERCRLKEADFSGADLSGALFTECDLQAIDLTRAKLQGADISGSECQEIRIGAGDVRGLVVNREQALALSRLFGIVLRD